MKTIILWIRTHKLLIALVAVIAFLLFRDQFTASRYTMRNSYDSNIGMAAPMAPAMGAVGMMGDFGGDSYMPQTESYSTGEKRMVVSTSYLSLLVEDVKKTKDEILQKADELGGFMVSSMIQNPYDAGSATIVIRIPAKSLDRALEEFRGMAVKVVTENLEGQDVTDQYTDIVARMKTYERTKAKFEEILDQAVGVPQILEVQRELINLQASIDSLKGQEKYLAETVKTAKLTIYLATDELALPYAPAESWRPEVVFKEAVRSLIMTGRSIANMVIWIAVYAVLWFPALLIGLFFYVRSKKKSTSQKV